ncbi:MAG: hypothetical protein PHD31_01415 [Candidatus Pacebacteria bacterium]|nr:hypothetical protein [Candidatus Paceibacterota bacterium]
MNEKSENFIVAGRFILGLSIIGGLECIAIFIHHSPMLPFMGGIIMPPLAILFFPPIISAIYFMFSSKMKWRLDILLFIISIICLAVFSGVNFGSL